MKDGYAIIVCGNFVIEIILPQLVSDYFRSFFDTITDINSVNMELFRSIFDLKTSSKLTIKYDPMHAQ